MLLGWLLWFFENKLWLTLLAKISGMSTRYFVGRKLEALNFISNSGHSSYFICFILEQRVCFQIPLLRIKMQKQNDIQKIFSFGLHFSSLHFLVWHSSNMWYVLNNWNCDSYRYTKIGNQYNHTKNTNNTTLVGIFRIFLCSKYSYFTAL